MMKASTASSLTFSARRGTIESMRIRRAPACIMLLLLCAPVGAAAAEPSIGVSPAIVTLKGNPRDILKDTLTLTNNTKQKRNVYALVRDVDPERGTASTSEGTARAKSLAQWIEISRGVIELDPGESKEIPFLVNVNLRAAPGVYHGRISFGTGRTRAIAEKRIDEGAESLITVEVLDTSRQRLSLGMFLSDKTFFSGDTASFSYLLENTGDTAVSPKGEIRIFNRRGEEVGTVPVNQEGESLSPEESSQLASAWDAAGRFGKYKAFLDITYGDKQLGSVQDTVYFWVFPWRQILIAFMLVAALGAAAAYFIHMRLSGKHELRFAHHSAAAVRGEPEDFGAAAAAPRPQPAKQSAATSHASADTAVKPRPSAQHRVQLGARSANASNNPAHVVRLEKRDRGG